MSAVKELKEAIARIDYDDRVFVTDIHGDEEELRVLWRARKNTDGSLMTLRVRSISKSHKKPFNLDVSKIVRVEPKKRKAAL